jgi:hypothetical protein
MTDEVEARLGALQAAVVALAAAVHPARAPLARALLHAAALDLDEAATDSEGDAARAAVIAVVLQALPAA